MQVSWLATTENAKTGPLPTGFIGATVTDALESCREAKCGLRPEAGGGCYAWEGTPALVMRRFEAERGRVEPLTLREALRRRSPLARFVRLGALGDPCVLFPHQVRAIRGEAAVHGLGLLGYTHAWDELGLGEDLSDQLMASCDTLVEADRAVARGWRAAAIVPGWAPRRNVRTPGGRRVVMCPAQTKRVTCNDCGACDAQRKGPAVIGFRDHSRTARRLYPAGQLRLGLSRAAA